MNQKDIEKVIKVRENSHSPYSNYKVGALLKCKNGNIYTGCNIENHGIQSICAERVAFAKALSEGEREFESIIVIGGHKDKGVDNECMPCGYCRQFMSEFVSEDFKIYTTKNGKIKKYVMSEILPNSFNNL